MPTHAWAWKQYITVDFENAYQRPITHIYCKVEIFVVAGDQNTKIPIPPWTLPPLGHEFVNAVFFEENIAYIRIQI